MKKLLNTILGYKLLVIIPSQLLQIIESCIVIATLGFVYSGWVFKYVIFLNDIKEDQSVPALEPEKDLEERAERLIRMHEELLNRPRAKFNNPRRYQFISMEDFTNPGIYNGGNLEWTSDNIQPFLFSDEIIGQAYEQHK